MAEGWDKMRQLISSFAGRTARLVIKADLKDPMSGFFLMRRQTFEGVVRNLSQQGFKILLDLFASAPRPLRFAEVPYQFRPRTYGESKLDTMVAWEYGMLLADKMFGRFIPASLNTASSAVWIFQSVRAEPVISSVSSIRFTVLMPTPASSESAS